MTRLERLRHTLHALADAFGAAALTLWVGGLWAVGYLAVPILFAALPDPMQAGAIAGDLFSAIGTIGLFCGAYLLLFCLSCLRYGAVRKWWFWFLVAMFALSALQLYVLQPQIADIKLGLRNADAETMATLRASFSFWHGFASILYLLQSLLGLLLVGRAKNLGE